MKRIIYFSVLSITIFSCSSTKKIDFKQAYKFSTYSYTKQQPVVRDNPIFIASKESSIGHVPVIPNRLPLIKTRPEEQLTKKEKKNIIKEIKQIGKELKRLRKVDPVAADIKADQATKALTGKVYAGALIGGAGLILLILKIASPLGVLAFVVGLGLIVWGLLERGL